MPFVLSDSGKSALNADGKLDVNNAVWKKNVQFYSDLVNKDKVSPQIPSANSSSVSAKPVSGWQRLHVSRRAVGPDQRSRPAQAKFEVGIAPMPTGASGSKTWSDGSGFGVTQSCKNPDEAFKAVSVITGCEAEKYLGNAGRAYPALISAQDSWYKGNKTEDVKPVMDYALKNSVPFKTTATWQQVTTVYVKQAVATYNGQGSVDDLLSQTQAQGDS